MLNAYSPNTYSPNRG